MLPAVKKGSENAGRDFSGFAMCVMPLVATAEKKAALADEIRDVRARVAFYASTPAYLAAFETQGHGEAARRFAGAVAGAALGGDAGAGKRRDARRLRRDRYP